MLRPYAETKIFDRLFSYWLLEDGFYISVSRSGLYG